MLLGVAFMKKKLPLLFGALICFSIFSCVGGIANVPFVISVYIEKEDGTRFTENEVSLLRLNSNGRIYTDKCDENNMPIYKDGGFRIQYELGYAHSMREIQEIEKSWKKKMNDFWFMIDGTSIGYEVFTMKPLEENYVISSEPKESKITYIIKLKKKL